MSGNTQNGPVVKKLGMVGTGSMGSNMGLLFAEYGTEVHCYDPSESAVDTLVDTAKHLKLDDKIVKEKSYEALAKSLEDGSEPKWFVFSIPHGEVGDKVVEGLKPNLTKGDIIIDASNEHWQRTEHRQSLLDPDGVHYVGMGVSGGYQSARHGPSCSPGGSPEALEKALPFIQQFAAKDKHGKPCTTKVGPGGSGHYVKMVHNGIEQGMMSIIAETWSIMTKGLGMTFEEVAQVFDSWNKDGPLRDNFLVDIGVNILRTKDDTDEYVLSTILDKTVQDVDDSEGTGVWTCEEAAHLHVSAPTISAAHLFRCASAFRDAREAVAKAVGGATNPGRFQLDSSKEKTVSLLRDATYASFLMSYVQGMHIIQAASEAYKWNLNYGSLMQLWRGGCIIQSDFIVDLLEKVYQKKNFTDNNILTSPDIASELSKSFAGLKQVVLKSIEYDHYVPAISASLEWYKYNASTSLPTQFMEAELDYFGSHNFDLQSEGPGVAKKGKHHYEWKPAKGIRDDK